MKTETKCEHCGGAVRTTAYRLRDGRGRYCSAKCRSHWRRKPPEQRFEEGLRKDGPVPAQRPELGPCWEWQGAKNARGYGVIRCEGRTVLAHRFAWMIANGAASACVLHRCDNPSCCNPAHLFLGTRADNVRDMDSKGRRKTPLGSRRGTAKLTEAQALAIREQAAQGVPRKLLAERFGVHYSTVRSVVLCVYWRHV